MKNIKIIHTIRNPISSINSSVKNWLRYKNGVNFFAKDLYFQFDKVFNGITNLLKVRKKILIVQLEKLHDNRKKVVMDFCRIFNLKYERCLMNSTYFNFFPMKSELLTWKNTLKHKRIKHILSIPYFFLKRIIFINKFFVQYKYLPYSLG